MMVSSPCLSVKWRRVAGPTAHRRQGSVDLGTRVAQPRAISSCQLFPAGRSIRLTWVARERDGSMPQSIRKTEVALSQPPTYIAGPLSVSTAKPLVEADPSCPIERRNLTSRQALLHRITTEYDEIRGLRLTAAQAQRLFGLREDICLRVFNALVEAAILRRDVNHRYARHDRS